MKTKRHAFTLIELLIVVAIIAILAAIAVPNFLEAQTRSKVSRVKADMRSIATGMEAYRVDSTHYPIPSDENGNYMANPLTANVSPFETRVPILLTTPIAYLSSRPSDPFTEKQFDSPRLYSVFTREFLQIKATTTPTVNWLREYRDYFRDLTGQNPPAYLQYYMYSFGPDNVHNADVAHAGPVTVPHVHGDAAIYDPTNGTISAGDIVYIGPGSGFMN